MAITQIIQVAERLPLPERFQIIETLDASIRREMEQQQTKKILATKEEPKGLMLRF